MADMDKVWIGYLIGIATLVVLVCACVFIGNPPNPMWLNVLLLVVGGLCGWGAGILASPQGEEEKSQFAMYRRAILAFLTGFVLAKVDRLFDLAVDKGAVTISMLGPSLIFVGGFVLGALFTFVGRRYLKM